MKMSKGIQVFDGDCIDWQEFEKYTAEKKAEIIQIKVEVSKKQKELKNAQRNRNRQRAREEDQKPTRIPSSFWANVVMDYSRKIRELLEKIETIEGSMLGAFRERSGFRWLRQGE